MRSLVIHIIIIISLFSPSILFADYPLLKKYIIEFNVRVGDERLFDNSYRGEEGILQLMPEVGVSLGLKILMEQDYIEAVRFLEQAERSLEAAKSALYTSKNEQIPDDYSRKIIENILDYKSRVNSAKMKFEAYRSRLSAENDDRLDESKCSLLMDRLLDESLLKADNSLRDALGHFYNLCHGENKHDFPLTAENVRFVNYVFGKFLDAAPGNVLGQFNLDRQEDLGPHSQSINWKMILTENASRFIPYLEEACRTFGDDIYRVDPVLFISLMRRESNFDPDAVSYVGAAGLTQIMPETAKSMGMENIHMPVYFHDAISILKRERDLRREAMTTLFRINSFSDLGQANQARRLIQESLEIARRREILFSTYKRELLEKREDDRIDPDKAIRYGLRYFAKMMKAQNGDMSLALASYNAGLHRVEEYGGIPPFEETVGFRNQVLKFYRDYLKKVR